MKNSVLARSAVAVAALSLALTACGGQQEQSPSAGSDGGGAVETSEPAEEATGDASDDEATESESDSGEDDSDSGSEATGDEDASGDLEEDSGDEADEADGADEADSADEAAGTLQIALDGQDTEFTPEIVRCNGEPGTIRNVVITMREDLPVVKVTPGEFAMVKLHDRGEPEKSSSTEDITAEDGTISFDQASIGGAVVDGTVECLQGSN